jgi:hypothetical protein
VDSAYIIEPETGQTGFSRISISPILDVGWFTNPSGLLIPHDFEKALYLNPVKRYSG